MRDLLLGAGLLLSGLATAATPSSPGLPMISLEKALETMAAQVELPTTQNGDLIVHPCARCTFEHYSTDGKTAYFARQTNVSVAELRSLLTASPRAAVTVLLDARSNVVTRIKADLPAPTRRTP
jgi:hypothetical protein